MNCMAGAEKISKPSIFLILMLSSFITFGQEVENTSVPDQPCTNKILSIEEIRYQPIYKSGINNTIQGFYKPIDDFGFFCKLELKQEQKSIIPIRFRLGTLDYVNKYENKN